MRNESMVLALLSLTILMAASSRGTEGAGNAPKSAAEGTRAGGDGVVPVLAAQGGGATPAGGGPSAAGNGPAATEGGPAASGAGPGGPGAPAGAVPPAPPMARREETADTIHGVKVADPYRWLENVDSPSVKEWMSAQDTYARAMLARLPGREYLQKRFHELLYVDSISAPYHRGGRYFYMRRAATQEKSVLYWRDGEAGAERVLIDPVKLSADGSIALGTWSPSYDGKLLAYTLKKNNSDASILYIRDIDTGRDLEKDVIADAKYAHPSWTPDSKGFYYDWLPDDPAIAPSELPGRMEFRFHAVGSDPKSDRVVHPALNDPTRFIGGFVSRDGHYLFAMVQHGWSSNDVYYKDLRNSGSPGKPADAKAPSDAGAGTPVSQPAGPGASPADKLASEKATMTALGFRSLLTGQTSLNNVDVWNDAFYLTTNDGAPLYKVYKIDPSRPARENWREIVPESDAAIDSTSIFGGQLVVNYLRRATSEAEVRDLSGKLIRKIPLPGLGSIGSMAGNPDEDDLYFTYSSFTQPLEILRTSIKSGKTSIWKKIEVPVDTSSFTVDQVFYPSKDGTKISMFLVRRKDMKRNSANPVLLTGYGGFNQSETPYFSATATVWLEAGGVFALPNLRGGAEYGEDWHRGGMGAKKQNVFDDFIAAAQYLVSERYTSPDKLSIMGGSNGGLLVGAAMVQRPDLFGAVVCAVPLLDMIRYHKFGAGQTWVGEYGSAEDPDQFKTLQAYSPYHHVVRGSAYPALLMLSADSDDRVDPMHARKFLAAVQWAEAAAPGAGLKDAPVERPAWLRIEPKSGHTGADMTKERLAQLVDEFAFLWAQLGVKPPSS